MILKFRMDTDKWKYLDSIIDPEVDLILEFKLADRLGYTQEKLDVLLVDRSNKAVGYIESVLTGNKNRCALLNYYPPVSSFYQGNIQGVFKERDLAPENLEAYRRVATYGSQMLAISCGRHGEAYHIFTDCETYLLNDLGKTLNRLL
jgi:hypothetical protein